MPVAVTTPVQAQHVREGDEIEGRIVVGRKLGTKYARISFERELTQQYPLSEELPVTRMQPTKEEKAQQTRRALLHTLDYKEQHDRQRHAHAAAAVASDAAAGRFPNWTSLEDLAALVERIRLWDRLNASHAYAVQRTIEAFITEGFDPYADAAVADDAPTRFDVLADVVDSVLNEQLSSAGHLSHSSSPASVLESDGRRAGQASWLQEVRPLVKAVDL